MSVGHVARLVEEAGIPTVIIAARPFKRRMEMMTLPRVLLTPYIMGRPVGPAGEFETQKKTLIAALDLLVRADKSGTIKEL